MRPLQGAAEPGQLPRGEVKRALTVTVERLGDARLNYSRGGVGP